MELVSQVRSYTLRGAEKIATVWKKGVLGKALLVLSALLLALLIFAVLNALASPAVGSSLPAEQVSGVFADVNGDGQVDFIVNAEVIINNGPLGP